MAIHLIMEMKEEKDRETSSFSLLDKLHMNDSLRWLIQLIRKDTVWIAIIAVLQSFLVIFGLAYAVMFKNLLDSAVDGSYSLLFKYSFVFIFLMLIQGALNAVLLLLKEKKSIEIERKLKNRVLENMLYGDFSNVSSVHSGEWMNKLTNDVTIIARNSVNLLPNYFGVFIHLVCAMIILTKIIPRFMYFLFVLVTVALLFELLIYKRVKYLHKIVQEKDGRLRAFFQESLNSLMVIKAFTNENSILNKAGQYFDEYGDIRLQKNRFTIVMNFFFGTGINGVIILAAIYCAYAILRNEISYGAFVAVVQIIVQIRSPIANAYSGIPNYYSLIGSVERLRETELHCPIINNEEWVDGDFDSIVLEDVSFSYQEKNNNKIVFNHLFLTLNKGDFVGISGPSGCGKSTLLKLLLSLYVPSEGLIQAHRGKMVENLNSKHRALFAIVPQDNQLMQGTIREIICFGKTYDEIKMKKALAISCCDEFLSDLKDGINAELKEKGGGLSEGQMQRVAIARALYSGRPILLLDEATSALNEELEMRILHNLKELTTLTVVLVTHRRNALSMMNKNIVCTRRGGNYQWVTK